ncbi:MAG: prephenate dehydrogenase/arogenate dehydrogenase family protein [Sporomusaceae bacterium]|jgi:prephenate dehydrogenase|nr:prephenate dehydrogenase/arogenate dehydrogenase family protein [Sporomusaceae bacterium]
MKQEDILKITIIGLGLIGGSLGLALKAALGEKIAITGADKNEASLAAAKERGAIDVIAVSSSEAAACADFVFLGVPMLQMTPVLQKIAPFLKPGAIVSDVGSTKGYLVENALNILPAHVHFVPGHPMAGREESGIGAANVALFQGKWYIFATYDNLDAEATQKTAQLIKKTGAKITFMDIASHDAYTALISHVPHVAAAAMVNLLAFSEDADKSLKLAGGGFRDTTRIASSNADMWADILLTNKDAIITGLEKFQNILDNVIMAAKENDRAELYNFFAAAKTRRDALLEMEAMNIGSKSE